MFYSDLFFFEMRMQKSCRILTQQLGTHRGPTADPLAVGPQWVPVGRLLRKMFLEINETCYVRFGSEMCVWIMFAIFMKFRHYHLTVWLVVFQWVVVGPQWVSVGPLVGRQAGFCVEKRRCWSQKFLWSYHMYSWIIPDKGNQFACRLR